MTDDLFNPSPQDTRRVDTSFLTRVLDGLLRLAEIYAAERNIQTDNDPGRRVDPQHSASRVNQIPPVGPASAEPVGNSLARAEQPATVAQHTDSNQPRRQLPEEGQPAPARRRGGWTKGNSTSAHIRAGAVEFLRGKGARASGREICEALQAKGLVINAKDPSALVSSRIGRSPLFDHTYKGYGLVEWSRDTAEGDG